MSKKQEALGNGIKNRVRLVKASNKTSTTLIHMSTVKGTLYHDLVESVIAIKVSI